MDALRELLGDCAAVQELRERMRRLARRHGAHRPPNVLIHGETGTGKGQVATLLHRLGPRANGPFVDVNCAAIPETLLESELFGYERGAFTDARRAKPGLFQTAHLGTIFLDEVGLMPEAVQAKLLKVIEERSVRRLGGVQSEPVDVWVISATNEDLAEAIRERQFREDLYHRLAVVTLGLPPLRDRSGDVLLLAEHFLARTCDDYGLPRRTLGPEARRRLLGYGWPGNIRELANVMERAALLSEGSQVTSALLGLKEEPSAEPLHRRSEVRPRLAPAAARPADPEASRAPVPEAPAVSAPEAVPVGAAIRWERRRVTWLQARLTTDDTAEALANAGRWLEIMIDKVRSFGGRIQDLSPTGIGAAFGLEPVEDAARRAAHAALAIQKAAERVPSDDPDGPRVKVGIHTSQVMVGRMGEAAHIAQDDHRQATAVLEALVASAPPGAILVSAITAPFLERRLELIEVGDAPVRMYRLAVPERRGLGLWGSMGRFVGRRQELQMLMSSWASALKGHGQVVALVGESGVGKSRLASEFTHAEAGGECLLLETGSASYASSASYLPVIQLLKSSLGIEPLDDAAQAREKIITGLEAIDADLAELQPPLLTLLDVPVDDPRWNDLDPPQRRQRMLNAVKRLFLRLSTVRPILLLVEDAHWIDAESQALLDTLVDGLATARILLIVTYRPEYQHGWAGRSFYTQLAVDTLPPEHAEELLHGLLGDHPTLPPLTRALVEWTEGNPFFLEESVRTLVETGALEGERGAYRLVRPAPSIQVPPTVQELLAERLDRLPALSRRLLQSAAAIGKDVGLPILAAIAEMSDETLRDALEQLQMAELLYATSVAPETVYTFKHALTHEVAYGSVPEADRRALHARILTAMEARYADRLAERVERLAHHAMRGEVWDKAVTYLRQAGAKAFLRSANREAVRCFEHALAGLGHVPETPETVEQAIDLRFDLRLAFFPLGELEAGLRYLREAERLATALGDQRRLGWALAYTGNHRWLTGHLAEARSFGERAQAIATALGDFPLGVVANYVLGLAYQASGDCPRGEASFLSIIRSLEGDWARERFGLAGFPVVICRCWLAWCLAERGQFEEAIAYGREAIRLAETLDHRFSLAWATWGLAHVYLIQGEVGEAARLLERSRALSVEEGHLVWPHVHAWSFGHLRALSGQVAESIALLHESLGIFEARGLGVWQSLVLVRLGDAYKVAGRLADARASAERGLMLARERTERGHEAWALWLLAEIDTRADALDAALAEGRYREAMARAGELGMRPLVAHGHLGLAGLHRRTGDRQQREAHLAAATTMYREMGMRFWLERIDAERGELGVTR